MTPPENVGFLQTLVEYAWAGVLALGGLVYRGQEEKIKNVSDEMLRQRDNIAKLFDKLEEHSRRSEDRHHELMNTVHERLSQKADR